MNRFSLSSLHALPNTVQIDGCSYPIHTDFRVILRIFRMLADAEIAAEDKQMLLRAMFFKGEYPADAERGFEWFVRCGEETNEAPCEKDFDYEQDAREIYSAFRQMYGIDLLCEKLHWWVFSALLGGVFAGENALTNKIRLRHMDDSEQQRKMSLDRQKRAVMLRQTVSRRDAALEEQIRQRLQKGLPIDDLMSVR